MRGVIVRYDSNRRFGYVRRLGPRRNDIFFHVSDVEQGADHVAEGCRVRFQLTKGEKGPKAVKLRVSRPQVAPRLFFTGGAIFIAIAVVAFLTIYVPSISWFMRYLIGINSALIALAGFDKSASTPGMTRIPEKVLLLLAAAGGSFGLILGMQFFRHKTRKARFQFWVLVILAVQLVAIRVFFPSLTIHSLR